MEAEERQEVLRWRACVPDFSSSELRAARSGGGCAHRRRACALVAGEALGAPMPADGLHWFAGRVGLRSGATGADLLEPHRVAGGLADGERARKTEA